MSLRLRFAPMRVLVTLPWEKHIEFLRRKMSRDQISAMVRSSVAANRGQKHVNQPLQDLIHSFSREAA